MTTKTFEIPVQTSRAVEVTFPFYAKRETGLNRYTYYCFQENGNYVFIREDTKGVFTVIRHRMDLHDEDGGLDFIDQFKASEQQDLKTEFAMLAQKIKFSIETITGHKV